MQIPVNSGSYLLFLDIIRKFFDYFETAQVLSSYNCYTEFDNGWGCGVRSGVVILLTTRVIFHFFGSLLLKRISWYRSNWVYKRGFLPLYWKLEVYSHFFLSNHLQPSCIGKDIKVKFVTFGTLFWIFKQQEIS